MAGRFRHFELRIGVFTSIEGSIPETFEDWLRIAFGDDAVKNMDASPTTLLGVTETRYPLADDIVEMRKKNGTRIQYG